MKNLAQSIKEFRGRVARHEHTHFDTLIILLIVLGAVANGLETSPQVIQEWGWYFHLFDQFLLWVFVGEISLKIWAQGARPWRYFSNPWNLFDFIIVAVGFAPVVIHFFHPEYSGDFHAIAALRVFRLARAVRVLRVFRLITHVRELQILVETLVRSFRRLIYVALLLFCLFYVYAVLGVSLFREDDPAHFADLHTAHMTLFQCITGEGWSDVMNAQIQSVSSPPPEHFESYPILAPLYFASFIILGSYVLLNLVVGIMISAMEKASEEHDRLRDDEILVAEDMQLGMLREIICRLERLEQRQTASDTSLYPSSVQDGD